MPAFVQAWYFLTPIVCVAFITLNTHFYQTSGMLWLQISMNTNKI